MHDVFYRDLQVILQVTLCLLSWFPNQNLVSHLSADYDPVIQKEKLSNPHMYQITPRVAQFTDHSTINTVQNFCESKFCSLKKMAYWHVFSGSRKLLRHISSLR